MVSIFQGLYKEKYNRCRQNYKLVDVEYKGEAATETEEEAGRAAFSYRISCSASAASERNLETFFIILCRIFERKPNTMQLREKMGLAIQEISLDADESGNSFPVY